MLIKHPGKVPVIVERAEGYPDVPQVDRKKFLLPRDFLMAQVFAIIRKRLHLLPGDALCVFIGGPPGRGTLASATSTISSAHSQHADEDGLLYITYNFENYFGARAP